MKKKKEKALERESEPPSNLDYWTDYYPLPFTDAATSSSKKLLEIKPAASTEFRKHICFQGATKRSRRKKRKLDKSRKELTLCMHSQEKKLATTFGTEMVKLEVTPGLWKFWGKIFSLTYVATLTLFDAWFCLARTRNFSNGWPISRFKWKNSYRKSQLASSSYPLLSLSKVLLQFETEGQNHLSVRQTKLDQ